MILLHDQQPRHEPKMCRTQPLWPDMLRKLGKLTSTGMMHTVYIGGLMAANHSCPRVSPVASMAACCASPGSGETTTLSPSEPMMSEPAAAVRCCRHRRSFAGPAALEHRCLLNTDKFGRLPHRLLDAS